MKKPTDSELEILQVLWDDGESTVRAVNEKLSESRHVGYTTTLKLMQIMTEKGLLARRKEGKTHIYSPTVSKSSTQQQLLSKLLHSAFDGSASSLVIQALGNSKSSKKELDEIREFLNELDKKKR